MLLASEGIRWRRSLSRGESRSRERDVRCYSTRFVRLSVCHNVMLFVCRIVRMYCSNRNIGRGGRRGVWIRFLPYRAAW